MHSIHTLDTRSSERSDDTTISKQLDPDRHYRNHKKHMVPIEAAMPFPLLLQLFRSPNSLLTVPNVAPVLSRDTIFQHLFHFAFVSRFTRHTPTLLRGNRWVRNVADNIFGSVGLWSQEVWGVYSIVMSWSRKLSLTYWGQMYICCITYTKP